MNPGDENYEGGSIDLSLGQTADQPGSGDPAQAEKPADNPRAFSVKEFKERLTAARKRHRKWAKEATECYSFYDGDQWSDEDKQKLKALMRPHIVFNRLAVVVDGAKGASASAQLESKYLPRTVGVDPSNPQGDATGGTDIANQVNKYFRQMSNAQDEELEQSSDMFIGGVGWTNTRLDFEEDRDGQILIEHIDPFTVLPDPNARKRNFLDAEYVIAVDYYSRAGLEEKWPGKSKQIRQDMDKARLGGGDFLETSSFRDEKDDMWPGFTMAYDDMEKSIKSGRYPVFEYQWWERENYFLFADPQQPDRPVEMKPGEHAAMGEQLAAQHAEMQSRLMQHQSEEAGAAQTGVMRPPERVMEHQGLMQADQVLQQKIEAHQSAAPMTRRMYKRAFLSGDTLLSEPEELGDGGFTYKAKTGKWDRKKGYFYGIVRTMQDPQRYANKVLSTSVDILQSHPKGQFFIESDAIEDEEAFNESINRHDAATVLSPGAIAQNKVMPKTPPPQIPQLSEIGNTAAAAIMEVSGVNPALLGRAGSSAAGVTVNQYIKQGFAVLSTYFQSEKVYRTEQARLMLSYMRMLPSQTIARIIESADAQYIEQFKDRLFQKYDIVTDEAPSSPNVQSEVLAMVQMFLPTLEKLGVGPMIFKPLLPYLPGPASLRHELSALLGMAMPGAVVGPPGPPLPGTQTVPQHTTTPNYQDGAVAPTPPTKQ